MIKKSVGMLQRNKNTIKNCAFGLQEKYKITRHNIGNSSIKYFGKGKNFSSRTVKYLEEEGIKKFRYIKPQKFGTAKRNLYMRSDTYMKAKGFKNLIYNISKSKPQLPLLFATGGLSTLTHFNLAAPNDELGDLDIEKIVKDKAFEVAFKELEKKMNIINEEKKLWAQNQDMLTLSNSVKQKEIDVLKKQNESVLQKAAELSTEVTRLQNKFEKLDHDEEMSSKILPKGMDDDSEFFKICFTGGPCAGKTTSIAKVSESLRELGYTVFVVPEAATLIFNGGGDLDLNNYTEESGLRFQYLLLKLQTSLEDIYSELALLNQNKVVVLCDRGFMDGSAYLNTEQWNKLINDYEIDVVRMRDRRYDMVVHLVTAADGAPQFYTSGMSSTNNARVEDINSAIKLDKKLQQAWMAHPLFVPVDNRTVKDFKEKIERVEIAVMRLQGSPTSVKFRNKYLIKNEDGKLLEKLRESGLVISKFNICDTFIKGTDDGSDSKDYYIRKRYGDSVRKMFIKNHNEIKKGADEYSDDQLITHRRQISWKEYESQERLVLSDTRPVVRERAAFLWKDQSFILDTFNVDEYSFAILIIQSQIQRAKTIIPEILSNHEVQEITDQDVWQVSSIAKKNWQPPDKIRDHVLRNI